MNRRPAALLLAVLVLVTGCRPELIGAPTDGTQLHARFDHVDNLVVGHAVQLADVPVGVVTDIRLDGYEAVVRFVVDGVRVPTGTTASIGRTSLLGEDHVQLAYPDEDVTSLPDHDPEVALTAGPPSRGLEDVTTRAVELLGALSGDDIRTVVDAGVTITAGNEERISALVADVADVTGHYAQQRDAIASTIDTMAGLGADLADDRDAFATLLDDVDAATGILVEQRHRMVDALRAFSHLTDAAQGSVLGGTRTSFEETLTELGPVLAAFTEDPDRLPRLIEQLMLFVDRIPAAVREDELELFGLITIALPTGGLTP